MLDNQHDRTRPWTPGPWVSLAGVEDGDRDVEGYHAFAVQANYRCDGYPAEVAWALDVDGAAWPGIGDSAANARLIALAPEMAEAILADYAAQTEFCQHSNDPDDPNYPCDCAEREERAVRLLVACAEKLRALSRNAEEANQ